MENKQSQNWEVLYSQGKNDEYSTPLYGVLPLIKYIPQGKTVWCPFDKKDSAFVKVLSEAGIRVLYSHIDYGEDFYKYEPSEDWDILISNPPFTNKRKIFERAISFKKPFALLMSNTWLNDSAPKQLFKNYQLQLLMFPKRMKFADASGRVQSKITFSSSYFCHDFLPRDIVMDDFTECEKYADK